MLIINIPFRYRSDLTLRISLLRARARAKRLPDTERYGADFSGLPTGRKQPPSTRRRLHGLMGVTRTTRLLGPLVGD